MQQAELRVLKQVQFHKVYLNRSNEVFEDNVKLLAFGSVDAQNIFKNGEDSDSTCRHREPFQHWG